MRKRGIEMILPAYPALQKWTELLDILPIILFYFISLEEITTFALFLRMKNNKAA